MKGVVFTEFLEMVESRFSGEMVEELLGSCDLASGGAYTSIGTYDHRELIALVGALSERTGAPAGALVHEFGRHLLRRFTAGFPVFFTAARDTFGFLGRVEGYVHTEVRKLYEDAELPTFECKRESDDRMDMVYRSSRGFADLAHGLIVATAEHYGEEIAVEVEDLSGGARTHVRFRLRKLQPGE
ncbi:heme NO-binding domain-containing protein [Nannocystis punicea]|uniref:Heme NO-binding domain-containing protein n=1 Tax=Nannocystis punicea TaxID=2995304 RepID=A0ABY7H4F8_9BACT|nr:heme NO-binding domain-containing protein [Nannocystis poenicansa]WAS94170.1 heme NO-binding domain-containing protein [Nannocystis poenicansa]